MSRETTAGVDWALIKLTRRIVFGTMFLGVKHLGLHRGTWNSRGYPLGSTGFIRSTQHNAQSWVDELEVPWEE